MTLEPIAPRNVDNLLRRKAQAVAGVINASRPWIR